MSIIEANKCANSISKCTDLWFDSVKIKISDVSAIISIYDLVSKIGNTTGLTSGSETSTEFSGPPLGLSEKNIPRKKPGS